MRSIAGLVLAAAATACIGPQDDPSNVHDLRILAARSEPPEIMVGACPQLDPNASESTLVAALTQLATEYALKAPTYQVSALIVDPQGGGRTLSYDWFACTDTPYSSDEICDQQPIHVHLGSSQGPAGVDPGTPGRVVTVPFTPSVDLLTDAFESYGPLVLFGIRYMITLHVTTPDGSVDLTAGKRVQLSCKEVDGQTAATNPAITSTSLALDGQTWLPGANPTVGAKPHDVLPADPTSLEQAYVVPTYTGGSQALTEAWQYTYAATAGHFDSFELGGTDFTGQGVPIDNTWTPLTTDSAQDVTFYFLVRNGRGGETWTTRTAHLNPGP